MNEWPPAAEASTAWRVARTADGQSVRLCAARLWGERVEIDARGLVFCPYCFRMVTVDELGQATNTHGIGLRRTGTLLLPMNGDNATLREPSIMDESW
ncbi:hypothetical protein ACQPYH_04170 [Kribbella sp. CA-245084]|uniref:hypothetical protein n=1 Tax=Kribbella sp. CA-245084 TaxID=3239940 RepID=UPI003D94ABB6